AIGGSKSEEFLHPSPIGEDTFVRSAGGYAANVEAVTTPAPAPVDASGVPAAKVYDTPDSATIETLVDAANRIFPRDDRPWEAADTLKNRSEEHTSELQSRFDLVCRLLLEKKKKKHRSENIV